MNFKIEFWNNIDSELEKIDNSIYVHIQPPMTQVNELVQFGQNLDLKIKKEINSYECCVYESVEYRSLS